MTANGTTATVKKKTNKPAVTSVDKVFFSEMMLFNEKLNAEPASKWVKTNKYSDNAKYIPIRIVETLLRSIFGVYQVEMAGPPLVIGNSIVVTVHLKVWHPILQQWLTFAGTGAVPIQVQSGAGPMEWERINSKALHKNVPAAKSFAISNAAKSIGQIFGSNLNGSDDMEIYDVYKVKA